MMRHNQTQNSELGTRNLSLIPHTVFLLVLAVYILAGTAFVPFHGDESTQVYMSRDYAYLFLDHDLHRVLYSETPVSLTEQELRLLNGTLPKYLIGLAWHLGGFSPSDLNEQWDWSADWNYNQQNGHAPTPELLYVSRWPSALLMAAGVVPMFLLGWALGGWRAAYLASLYYALNPALLLNGRRAMMEGSAIFFSLLMVLAGVWWLQALSPAPSPSGRGEKSYGHDSRWLAALALGIVAGLALSSKHTALFTVAAVFAVCGIYAIWVLVKPTIVGTQYIVSLQVITIALIAAGMFFALNPAWWNRPLEMPGVVLRLREDLLQTQVNVFGDYSGFFDQIGGFWRQVLVALPQYYEVPGWENFIGGEITRYEASPWRGVSVGGSWVGAVVFLVMIVAGVWALVRGHGNTAARLVIGAWALVVTLTTLLLTPLEWQRYYLPVYPALGLLAAMGIDYVIQVLLNPRTTGKKGNDVGEGLKPSPTDYIG